MCPSGQILYGFRARYGEVIDRLTILCIPWRSDVGSNGVHTEKGTVGRSTSRAARRTACETAGAGSPLPREERSSIANAHQGTAAMKGSSFRSLAWLSTLVFAADGMAQAPPPTITSVGTCPAQVRVAWDLSAIVGTADVRWQIHRGVIGQGFQAAAREDQGREAGAVGAIERDLRDFGPVLDGTPYFARVQPIDAANANLAEFSVPTSFAPSESPDGMFEAFEAAGPDPLSVRVDWNLAGGIGACADRAVLTIAKSDLSTSLTEEVAGTSGSVTRQFSVAGPGDYDVRIRAHFGSAAAQDAVGRESDPVRVTLSPPVVLPSLSILDVTIVEGRTASTQNAIVRLSPPSSQRVTVQVGARPPVGVPAGQAATEGTCAAGRDYTFAFRGIAFEPGRVEVQVPFTLCGDVLEELDETFKLGITGAVNAVLGDSIADGTIVNDDSPASTTVSVLGGFVTEDDAPHQSTVRVRLSSPRTRDVTATIGARQNEGSAREGSCAAGADYTFAFRSVTIPAGQPFVDVPYTVCGDTALEPDEIAVVGLTGAVNATLADSIAQVTIKNDDAAVPLAPAVLPNLQVNIDESPQFLTQQGPRLVHVLTVRNVGEAPASNVGVQSTLPRNVRFLRVEESQFSGCTGAITDAAGQALVRCSVSSLPAGASRLVRIVGEIAGVIPDSTRVVFGAQVDPTSLVAESVENDNIDFLSTIVRSPADLGLTGTFQQYGFSGEFDTQFGEFTMVEARFTVRNNGPGVSKSTTIVTTGDNLLFTPGNFMFQGMGELCDPGRFAYVAPGGGLFGHCETGRETSCFFACAVPGLTPGSSVVVVARGFVGKGGGFGEGVSSVLRGELPVSPNAHSVTFRSVLNPNGNVFGDVGGNNEFGFTTTLP